MSDHLPECPAATVKNLLATFPDMHPSNRAYLEDEICICPALRACEQRVSDPAWIAGLLSRRGEEQYAAGVQAARDAVDAACGWRPAGRCSECTHALAAIDALRGDL